MNDMRKLMETAARLDESVYIDNPKARMQLEDAIGNLERIIDEFELDPDDVVTLIEQKLYNTSNFQYGGV